MNTEQLELIIDTIYYKIENKEFELENIAEDESDYLIIKNNIEELNQLITEVKKGLKEVI